MADLVESDGYRPALRGLRSRVDYLIRLVRIVCPLMSLIEIYVRAYGNVRFLLFSRALGGRVLSHEDLGILDMILELTRVVSSTLAAKTKGRRPYDRCQLV